MTNSEESSRRSAEERRTAAVWPHLIVREAAVGLLLLALLVLAAVAFPLELLPPADPTLPAEPAKAPWFFVGLQEMLYHLPPASTAAFIPLAVVIFFLALPWMSRRPATLAALSRPLPALLFGAVGLALAASFVFLAVIPFVSQAVLTVLLFGWALLVARRPASRAAGLSLPEFAVLWCLLSYVMWTVSGLFFRADDWSSLL